MLKQALLVPRNSDAAERGSCRALPKFALAVVGSSIAFLLTACSPNGISPTEPSVEAPEAVTLTSAAAQLTVAETSLAGLVAGLDMSAGEILLDNGGLIAISSGTKWDRSGNIRSFRQLAASFGRGQTIRVKARGPVNVAGDLKARTIKAIAR